MGNGWDKIAKSIEVESYWIQKYPSGIYHLLFNTKKRWVYFHQYSETEYQIGGTPDDDSEEHEKFFQQIPEGLIPDNVSFLHTTLQEKDQISFYFLPKDMVFRAGEEIIYDSKNPKKIKK